MFEWDKSLEFTRVRKLLAGALNDARRQGLKMRVVWTTVLLTALVNGARAGESIEAVRKAKGREVEVRVRKRKGPRRRVVIPHEISDDDLALAKAVLAEKIRRLGERAVVQRLSDYCRKTYGFNPHSLRYAFISHLSQRGIAPQLVAKMTGHAKLDYVLYYTQQRTANGILTALAKDAL